MCITARGLRDDSEGGGAAADPEDALDGYPGWWGRTLSTPFPPTHSNLPPVPQVLSVFIYTIIYSFEQLYIGLELR